MRSKKDVTTIVAAGAAACAAWCGGPILGFLAALGVGTGAVALLGTLGLVVAGIVTVVVAHRRRPQPPCTPREVTIAAAPRMRTPR